jgi:hypothetical protein
MKPVIRASLIVGALCLVVVGVSWGQSAWVDEIDKSLAFSAANYPN